MTKARTPIPDCTLAEVLFQQDHTCCICREKGLKVQVHHINEDPSDNGIANLAVLCLQDHDRTLQSGGFGRQLKAQEVVRYRDDWINRVRTRRDEADRLAAAKMRSPKIFSATSSIRKTTLFESDVYVTDWFEQIRHLKEEIYREAHEK